MREETKYYFEHDEEEYPAPWEGDILIREQVANKFLIVGVFRQYLDVPVLYRIGVWIYSMSSNRLIGNDIDDWWELKKGTTLENVLEILRTDFNSCVKFQRRLAEK